MMTTIRGASWPRKEAANGPTSAQIFGRWLSRVMRSGIAKYGKWHRKGAVLRDVSAHKEYGVIGEFIIKGIQTGKLEYREGVVWGNPYLRVLRSQLELYMAAQLGSEYLSSKEVQTELRAINKEVAENRRS